MGHSDIGGQNRRPTNETVCIDTMKIYDSCKDKDCLEDLRVYLCREDQMLVDRSINVKPGFAELLWVYIDVEPVAFNRGFFTVDIKYFYKVTVDVFSGVGRPTQVSGLCTFDKRVILFGSEGNAKIFSSNFTAAGIDEQLVLRSNMPKAVVETVEPIMLNAKTVETRHCGHSDCCCEFPSAIAGFFQDEITNIDGDKRLYCTIGQFSIIRLERDCQLLIPACDFCIPEKECLSSSDESPCDLFHRIQFPTDEFFPPDRQPQRDGKCGCR